jgi:hypothetical protein
MNRTDTPTHPSAPEIRAGERGNSIEMRARRAMPTRSNDRYTDSTTMRKRYA